MTNTIDARALGAALAALKKHAMMSKPSIPILNGVHIAWRGNGAVVTATDLDVWIEIEVPGLGEGVMVIEGAPLAAICKAAGKGDAVALTSSRDSDVRVDAALPGGTRARLLAFDPGDWPDMAAPGVTDTLTLPGTQLAAWLDAVAPCMSYEETRYYLRGVAFAPASRPDGAVSLHLVATDGHRLAEQATPYPAPQRPGIIPNLAVNALRALFGKYKGDVVLRWGERLFDAAGAGVRLRGKLIDGTFPHWRRMVPAASLGDPWSIPCAALETALKTSRAMATARTRALRLSLPDNVLHVVNPESGAMTIPLPGAVWRPGAARGLDIGFNGDLLRTFAATCPGDVVTLHMVDAGSPTRITATKDGVPVAGWTGVLMSMRI